ncbi:MAG: TrkH family potassium uptake protein [Pelagibacteraceae bacterium]|jgi:trk system potassium uptake protein|nr:TrkH family potassium uptake protein [Pelagibacteraceae bacterium]
MNFKGISYFLGLSCWPISILSFINILYSSYFDHYLNIDSYLLTLFISLFFSFAFYFISKNADKNIKFHEQLSLILIVYFFISLLISIPYYFSYYQISFIDSLFEAVSGLTTTGFTIFTNVKFLDPTLLIWRSTSHWLGGLFFLTFLILIFSNFKNEYKLTHLVYNPDKATNLFKDTKKIILKVFFLYSFFTGIIFILFSFSGIRLFNSLNLAMTVSSAGAFLPTNSLSDIVKNTSQEIILILGLTFSALNIYLIYSLFTNFNKIKKHYEDFMIIGGILISSLILFFSIGQISFLEIFLNVVSSISNSGISSYDPPKNFYLFFLFLTIIGGSLISNSAGIKLIRIYILCKSTILELFKLVTPNTIIDHRIMNTEFKINSTNLNSSFLIFICFFVSIFVLSSILSAGNLDFENSFKLAILTITNTVNSSLYGLDEIDFLSLLTSSKVAIILFMVLGKIELLSILLIIRKVFSRN